MPYTFAKFVLWGLLMALAGGIVGWLLRSLTARTQIARARTSTIDPDEHERLRWRVANLEPVVAERDRLRMELADVRGSSAGALGFSSTVDTSIIPDDAELDTPTPEPAPTEPQTAPSPEPVPQPDDEPSGDAGLDLDAAAAALGRTIRVDDLTVVEGIGPKIAELCSGIGITTWRRLAAASVDDLQSMLDAAGSRFKMHKPGSWPEQASLLAEGRWTEFRELTDRLRAGS